MTGLGSQEQGGELLAELLRALDVGLPEGVGVGELPDLGNQAGVLPVLHQRLTQQADLVRPGVQVGSHGDRGDAVDVFQHDPGKPDITILKPVTGLTLCGCLRGLFLLNRQVRGFLNRLRR